MRLKDVAFVNLRTLDESTKGDYKFRYIDISSVSADNGITLGDEITFQEAPSRARRIVKKDDVLVSTVRTYLRAIANIDWDAKDIIASTGFAVYTPNNKIIPRFLAYSIKSTKAINQICSNSKGVSYPAIQAQVLSSIEIPYWDLKRQEAIAAYLDKECEKIGRKIELFERKADAYSRLRRSLINRAVTRGLDPNVSLKPSTIAFETEIPSHWEIRRIKSLFEERIEYSYTGNEDLLSVSEYYGIAKRADIIDNENISRSDSLEGYKRCYIGDIVSNIMLAWKGSLGMTNYNGIVSPAYGVYKPICKLNSRYYHYLFRTELYKAIFKNHSRGIIDSRLRLYTPNFLALKTFYPPLSEQNEIAAYLDEKCAKIDAILEKINTEVERLKELKRSLINEVVTGQRAIDTESRS